MQKARFLVEVQQEGEARLVRVEGFSPAGSPLTRYYRLAGPGQQHYLDFYESLAADFGTRIPRNRRPAPAPDFDAPYQPLLTENLSPDIFYGYGDPAMLRAGDFYYLFTTSNDAPNAFPILRSTDLHRWEHAGFVFPEGDTPAWAASGADISDYWAPEVQRVGDTYLLCFAARASDGILKIGLATAPTPEGPYTPTGQPLIDGGAIDAHIFIDEDGTPFLFWKEDSNDLWPGLLVELLTEREDLAARLFATEDDLRTAHFIQASWPWIRSLTPMERFFALQSLIDAVAGSFRKVWTLLAESGDEKAMTVVEAMRTPIFAQRLTADGLSLTGERRAVLVNDLQWEGHLIEGPWVTRQDGRYYLFYAGNDFSTAEYGIGVAVSDHVFGPYRKRGRPLLRSTASWAGPGHPSIAEDLGGKPRLFFHAFKPGCAGYKEFRALLSTGLEFTAEGVELTS